MRMNIQISQDDLTAVTQGAQTRFGYEFRVKVNSPLLLQEADGFLKFVLSYLSKEDKRIKPGETLAYGYWLTKFEQASRDVLEVLEYNDDATEFVPGVTRALTYWRDQNAICQKYRAMFLPPRADRNVAISDGVYEGDVVEGVRYPSPEHMSGWWITTDRYNGDVKTLKVVHLYHVTAARPEIAQYLALPPGWYFRSSGDVWFDQEVAKEKP
jgi:hypothetical protein